MVTKECFGCEKVTSHEHLHDCAPGSPETHMVGSERFVCVLCKHVTRQSLNDPRCRDIQGSCGGGSAVGGKRRGGLPIAASRRALERCRRCGAVS